MKTYTTPELNKASLGMVILQDGSGLDLDIGFDMGEEDEE